MSDVLFIDDVAKKLGLTVDAIRGHLRRNNVSAVPPPFKLGSRYAWRRTDVDSWLANKAQSAIRAAGL